MMNSTQDPAVKKGSVLLTRMESITTYKNQHGQRRSECCNRALYIVAIALAPQFFPMVQ
ncbi:hypothetical protein ZWY2020_027951 [Hordeum vulgare]|nr:hypothetical protein ZWY2020_027951 [Hordeum vulgare]